MHKLLIVGDKPSKKNVDPKVAFIGTASYKRILQWLKSMGLESSRIFLINRVDPAFHTSVIHATLANYKILALGVEAQKALQALGVVKYYTLPHPSGRNRKLNNKKYIDDLLADCKRWVES
jgi:uracil-DNA glycosylase